MESGLPNLVGGKRRRDGFLAEEDLKDNLKMPRQWPTRLDGGTKEGFQNLNFQGLSVESWIRMQQQKSDMAAAATPSLNMQQRFMAAAALQDLRGINESSKQFFHPQLPQQMKYQLQQQPSPQTMHQLPLADTAVGSFRELSPSQPPQSPLRLPPPLIRTPPIYTESDLHNGSPTSSSSSPYPSLQNIVGSRSQPCSAPIQLQDLDSDQSYPNMLHASQNGLLQQQGGHISQNGLLQQQGGHTSQNGLLQQQGGHNSQNGLLQQQGGHTSQNGLLPQQSVHSSQNGLLQQGGQISQSGLLQQQPGPQNGILQQQAGHASQSGILQHHAVHASLIQQPGVHGAQNGLLHQQSGHTSQNGLLQHQAGHAPQNGMLQQPTVLPGGNSLMLRDLQQVPGSWYSSMRDPCTYSEAQPITSTSRLQRMDMPLTSAAPMGSPVFSPSVTEFGSQRGLVALPAQLGQGQAIYRDGPPEQELQSQFDAQSPLASLGSTKGCASPSARSEFHGRRLLTGPYCSTSSAIAELPLTTPTMMANGGLEDTGFLQRGSICPSKPVRSYTKVYKLGSITRALDVNRFSNYTELRCELAHMFNLEGQLDQKLGWQLVFLDNENDLLLVGDDPWEEFVSTVRSIRILSPSEVYFYTNEERLGAAYNSFSGGTPKQQ